MDGDGDRSPAVYYEGHYDETGDGVEGVLDVEAGDDPVGVQVKKEKKEEGGGNSP